MCSLICFDHRHHNHRHHHSRKTEAPAAAAGGEAFDGECFANNFDEDKFCKTYGGRATSKQALAVVALLVDRLPPTNEVYTLNQVVGGKFYIYWLLHSQKRNCIVNKLSFVE